MINLIPPSAKKGLVHEYYARVVIVWLVLLAIACLIIAILCLPTLVLVELQKTAVNSSFADVEAESLSFEAAKETIKETNTTAAKLDTVFSTTALLPIMSQVERLANQQIDINNVMISRAEDRTIATISVQGEAATRASLASFRDALQADDNFTDVLLPLSNLAKNEDVPFSITMGYSEVIE